MMPLHTLDDAVAYLKRCLRTWQSLLGDSHPYNALALAVRAGVEREQRAYAKARATLESAERMLRMTFPEGVAHEFVAQIELEAARLECATERWSACATRARQAVAAYEGSTGLQHSSAAAAQAVLAEAVLARGELEEAGRLLRSAHTTLTTRAAPQHPELARVHFLESELARAKGDASEARRELDAAVELLSGHGVSPAFAARVRERATR